VLGFQGAGVKLRRDGTGRGYAWLWWEQVGGNRWEVVVVKREIDRISFWNMCARLLV
jgi:hypothetical protein